MRYSRGLVLAAALAVASVFALTALAGSGGIAPGGTTLVYNVLPGEDNVVTVKKVGGNFTIQDTGTLTGTATPAPVDTSLDTTASCTLLADTITCPAAGVTALQVN